MTAVPLFKAAETAIGIGTAADEVCVLQLHAVCRIFESLLKRLLVQTQENSQTLKL